MTAAWVARADAKMQVAPFPSRTPRNPHWPFGQGPLAASAG
ncbi:hypothetical protein C8K18_101542 [Paraburkholderia sp. GV068]|nr:hypothetical protein C8K19_101467 [Paraburkholderia sp. GV072]PUB09026.1 hypothetical protein C8K18_101542 [Paraburkholderia sp. GV068]